MELSDAIEKTAGTPGIDPRTVRLVAQCLNHYATPDPLCIVVSQQNFHFLFIELIDYML
jgi:hypothetical protein